MERHLDPKLCERKAPTNGFCACHSFPGRVCRDCWLWLPCVCVCVLGGGGGGCAHGGCGAVLCVRAWGACSGCCVVLWCSALLCSSAVYAVLPCTPLGCTVPLCLALLSVTLLRSALLCVTLLLRFSAPPCPAPYRSVLLCSCKFRTGRLLSAHCLSPLFALPCAALPCSGCGVISALGGGSAPRASFTVGLPGGGWLSPPPEMLSKESKPLGTRSVYTSLHVALSVVSQSEHTQDGPLGATTTPVWDLPAGLSMFLPLSK